MQFKITIMVSRQILSKNFRGHRDLPLFAAILTAHRNSEYLIIIIVWRRMTLVWT